MNIFDAVAEGLAGLGYAVVDGFLSPQLVEELLEVIRQDEEADRLKKAGIGAQSKFQIDQSIRGDYIRWVEPAHAAAPTRQVLSQLTELIKFLNRDLYLGLKDLEVHFAKYPTGTFYKRHLDRFQQQSTRVISVVLYLNQHWEPGHGGELKIFLPEGGEKIVNPIAGRMVCFRSDTVPHEVLLAHRERYSLTGWLLNQPADLPFVLP